MYIKVHKQKAAKKKTARKEDVHVNNKELRYLNDSQIILRKAMICTMSFGGNSDNTQGTLKSTAFKNALKQLCLHMATN